MIGLIFDYCTNGRKFEEITYALYVKKLRPNFTFWQLHWEICRFTCFSNISSNFYVVNGPILFRSTISTDFADKQGGRWGCALSANLERAAPKRTDAYGTQSVLLHTKSYIKIGRDLEAKLFPYVFCEIGTCFRETRLHWLLAPVSTSR